MNNIVLIGMPGCGKSTVGVLLAKMLGYDFIDTDLLIQSSEGCRLQEIITSKGNDYFEEAENRILCGVSAQNTVIATGGSAVYCEEGMKHLSSIGRVVYLSVSKKEIKRRVGDLNARGVLMKEAGNIDELYLEREPLYKKYADITVKCGNIGLKGSAEKIIKALK